VDIEERLLKLVSALNQIQIKYQLPIIISTHPRTQAKMESFGIESDNSQLRFLPPFGFFDFISLEKNARCVLSDSGTVQEECAIFGLANVTIRDVTERPETLESGTNILAGVQPELILQAIQTVLELKTDWQAPVEYLVNNVSRTVIKLLLGYNHTFNSGNG
jgi:UDP-N-acetylglucosamine 2-epimerase (non-hydrolysing)